MRCRSTRSSRTAAALLDRLSECEACRTISRAGDAGARGGDRGGYGEALPRAVAINYAKLLAYKDEYEVARLYTDGRFEKQLARPVRGRLQDQLPSRAADDGAAKDALGRPGKSPSASWMMTVFRLLAKMRGLRGTALDIFGYSAERRLERDLIAGYEKDVATVLDKLSPANVEIAVELLSLPDRIRGYGPIKEKAVPTPRSAMRNWWAIWRIRRPRQGR